MTVETMALVLHHSRARGTAKVVLLGIANHDGDGGAWPSVATLARYANVDVRCVQRALGELIDSGELVRHVQDGGTARMDDHQRPNRYEVMVSCPPTCDGSSRHRTTLLPAAASDLWTTGVAPASPGGASVTPPLTPASPHPLTPASPKPSLRTSHESPSTSQPQPQTAPASCAVCGLSRPECERRARTSGHGYIPTHPSEEAS